MGVSFVVPGYSAPIHTRSRTTDGTGGRVSSKDSGNGSSNPSGGRVPRFYQDAFLWTGGITCRTTR